MKVSVIIPAHNEERHIEAVIKALLGQRYSDLEIIVVDNAGTDRTSEIAARFPVKVVHESRKGTQWAREKGREIAQGDVIANLDADCLPGPDWVAKGMAWFNDEARGHEGGVREIVAVTGPYNYYDGTASFRSFSLISQKYAYRQLNRILQYFHKGGIIIGGNVFIRADALMKVGGYNTSITFYGDDTDTARRLSRVGRIIFDNDLLLDSSARRFRAKGKVKIICLYVYHFLKHTLKMTGTERADA